MAQSIQQGGEVMSLGQQVIQFNSTYRVPVAAKPRLPTTKEQVRIIDMIGEELDEVAEALKENDIVHLAKELGDVLYVTAQQMAVLGIPVDAVLREIQASNMSKLDNQGKPIFRGDGKVLKGPNFFKAEGGIARVILEASEDI